MFKIKPFVPDVVESEERVYKLDYNVDIRTIDETFEGPNSVLMVCKTILTDKAVRKIKQLSC